MKNVCVYFGFPILISITNSSCGVKGKPLPPLSPPDIGRGEPSFNKTTEKLKTKKVTSPKKNAEADWESEEDSSEKESEKKTAP